MRKWFVCIEGAGVGSDGATTEAVDRLRLLVAVLSGFVGCNGFTWVIQIVAEADDGGTALTDAQRLVE